MIADPMLCTILSSYWYCHHLINTDMGYVVDWPKNSFWFSIQYYGNTQTILLASPILLELFPFFSWGNCSFERWDKMHSVTHQISRVPDVNTECFFSVALFLKILNIGMQSTIIVKRFHVPFTHFSPLVRFYIL